MLIHVQLTCLTSSSTDHAPRWDGALLAAGLQTGCRRADFLHDLHQQLTQHAHTLRVLQHDQLPDRHAAYVAYLAQQDAIPHYSRHG
eukprot:4982942-Pyramimonas_sp.AAC.1